MDTTLTARLGGAGLLLVLLLAGCASTPGNIRPATEAKPTVRVGATDSVGVRVLVAPGVALEDHEKLRLESRVREKIDAIKARNDRNAPPLSFRVDVEVTKYEKGNAFARAMLAGLGAMQIEATIRVFTMPEERKVAEFTADKTFAWGGIYGGSTSMEDVEHGFAEGIAEATVNPTGK